MLGIGAMSRDGDKRFARRNQDSTWQGAKLQRIA
jgi:hypothetical protein